MNERQMVTYGIVGLHCRRERVLILKPLTGGGDPLISVVVGSGFHPELASGLPELRETPFPD